MPPVRRSIAGIAIFILSCFLFFTPSNDLPDLGDWFGDWSMDKLIHSGLFFVLTIAWFYAFAEKKNKKRIFVIIAFLSFCYAALSEFIQLYFIPGRSFSLLDIAADALGVFLAYISSNYILKKIGNKLQRIK